MHRLALKCLALAPLLVFVESNADGLPHVVPWVVLAVAAIVRSPLAAIWLLPLVVGIWRAVAVRSHPPAVRLFWASVQVVGASGTSWLLLWVFSPGTLRELAFCISSLPFAAALLWVSIHMCIAWRWRSEGIDR